MTLARIQIYYLEKDAQEHKYDLHVDRTTFSNSNTILNIFSWTQCIFNKHNNIEPMISRTSDI